MPGGVEWTKQGKSTAEVFSKYIQVYYLACVYLCKYSFDREIVNYFHECSLLSYSIAQFSLPWHHHCIYQFIIITITVMIISFLDQYHGHYHRVCYCNEIIMMIIVYPLLLSLSLSLIVYHLSLLSSSESSSSLLLPVYHCHRQFIIISLSVIVKLPS